MTKEFFEKYQELKQSEQWEEIILLGNKALEITGLESKPEINLIIATSYHYLGNYQQTIEFAKGSLKILDENYPKNKDLKSRSFYLLSAGYRSLTISTNEFERDRYSTESHKYIESALNLIEENELKDFTKAKIYFNAGALYQDVEGNNEKAIEFYMRAKKLFQQGDDFNRTMIRHIRALLEASNLHSANMQAENLAKIISLETKTGVHLLQLQAKIFLKSEQYQKAYNYTNKALEIAEQKNMKGEVQRLQNLEQEILKKDPNAKEHVQYLRHDTLGQSK